ncbi:MAG: right-handed parallel beta-helix repeat-containing protein [Capsulimonadales bacterium]|nr:right-handed parallel beta-helix repeat-containing protein [Capsulimonadales bacterium]
MKWSMVCLRSAACVAGLFLNVLPVGSAQKPVEITVPADHSALTAALARAADGTVLRIGAGTVEGAILLDKPVTLIGAGRDKTVLRLSIPAGRVPKQERTSRTVTVTSTVTLRSLTVRGGHSALYQTAGSDLTLREVCLEDAPEDGVGFEGRNGFNTRIRVYDSEIRRCGDGIDLENTQAIVINTRFTENRDDGLDLDGNSGAIVHHCRFERNRDDGIEVRLARRAHLLAAGCLFTGNGEDGIELIDVPANLARDQAFNGIVVSHNTFRGNRRFGVGGVDQVTEEAAGTMVACGLFGSHNLFSEPGRANLSENLSPARLERGDERTVARWTTPSGRREATVAIRGLYPVAFYDLAQDPNGVGVRDAEGLVVSADGKFAFIADDDTPEIWRLNLADANLSPALTPGKGGPLKGPEGLTRLPDAPDRYLLSDDDGTQIVELYLPATGRGEIRRQTSIGEVFDYPEGAERFGRFLAFVGNSRLLVTDAGTLRAQPGFPITYSVPEYANHIAGIAFDGQSLLLTAAAYTQRRPVTDRSLLLAVTPADGTLTDAWHLGDYTNDPRGLDVRQGLIYLVDGYANRLLPDGKEINRLGRKLWVFSVRPPSLSQVRDYADRLPLRRNASTDAAP